MPQGMEIQRKKHPHEQTDTRCLQQPQMLHPDTQQVFPAPVRQPGCQFGGRGRQWLVLMDRWSQKCFSCNCRRGTGWRIRWRSSWRIRCHKSRQVAQGVESVCCCKPLRQRASRRGPWQRGDTPNLGWARPYHRPLALASPLSGCAKQTARGSISPTPSFRVAKPDGFWG